ncbi:hypothetical protein K4F52_005948 [Lecanicillium sp. MT-2017a]|nr:hypothetical protein K4F52_005948 [Lecanicillium sp. MT-2017a]
MSARAMIAEDMILMPRKRKRPSVTDASKKLNGDDVHPAFASEAPLPPPISGIATVSQPSPTEGLQALSHLGYANDKTGTRAILESIGGQSILDAPESSLADHAALQYRTLIRQLPPNTFVGKLVRFFFAKVGWQYDIVDELDFWEQLSTWENVSYVSRSQPHKLDPAVRYFPSLLFQILAQALLFQPARHESFLDDMKHAPDMDLVNLAAEFSDTGQQILSLFGAGDSALVKVQAGLQRACFLKTAGSVVEAWHVLGRAIKDAQELGLHQCGESPDPEFSENLAHARHIGAHHRIWLVLHLWDAHMAVVLGRPMGTTLDPSTVPFPPHYAYHQDPTAQANRIRPFDLILCGYHMAYKHLQEIYQLDPMKPGALDAVQRIQDAISTDLCHMPAWASSGITEAAIRRSGTERLSSVRPRVCDF